MTTNTLNTLAVFSLTNTRKVILSCKLPSAPTHFSCVSFHRHQIILGLVPGDLPVLMLPLEKKKYGMLLWQLKVFEKHSVPWTFLWELLHYKREKVKENTDCKITGCETTVDCRWTNIIYFTLFTVTFYFYWYNADICFFIFYIFIWLKLKYIIMSYLCVNMFFF